MQTANSAALLFLAFLASACAPLPPRAPAPLQPFTESRPLHEFVRKSKVWDEALSTPGGAVHTCPEADENCVLLEEIIVLSMSKSASIKDITNLQEPGVDEGDIVKLIGDHVVLLRRGRLFVFALATERKLMAAVDYVDVALPDEGDGVWYDEILTYGNTIIVLGYSYDVDASLVRLFELDDDGHLAVGPSYFFKSSDYFDADNYATRLVDGRLVIYMPRELPGVGASVTSGKLVDGKLVGTESAFSSETIYQPVQQSDEPVLHTVAICPLDSEEFRCEATSFVGPWGALSYISDQAVYIWLNSADWAYDYFVLSDRYVRRVARSRGWKYDDEGELAVIYRIPLDGGAPGMIQATGWPIDQFSFRETGDTLQVFIRKDLREWDEETKPAILDIPLAQFGAHMTTLPEGRVENLPRLAGYVGESRFVGSSLLYSEQDYSDDGTQDSVWIKDLDTRQTPVRVPVAHFIERIEPVGDVAIVIGSDETTGLGLTSVSTGPNPMPGQTHWLERAMQADERSHGFNYRRDRYADYFALPVIYAAEDEDYDDFWPDDATAIHMAYFSLAPDLAIRGIGELEGNVTQDDACEISCDDWYGDSRPFFIDEKFYALLGYELIEGYLSGATLHESARVNALDLLRDEK